MISKSLRVVSIFKARRDQQKEGKKDRSAINLQRDQEFVTKSTTSYTIEQEMKLNRAWFS
jgi:hypothetical protein